MAGDSNRHQMNPAVSRRQLVLRHPTGLGHRKQTHRHLRDPKMTTILPYQTHIEHPDCSVDDDITISFHPFFDTAKIVYTSSVDHRPPHTRKAIPFVAFLILLLPPFQDSCLGPKFGPVSFYFPFCLLLFLCVGVSVLGTNCFSFFVYSCMLWAILCFASTTFLYGIASPTSDLYLVTRRLLRRSKTLQTGMEANFIESCHNDAPTVARFPLTGKLPAHTGSSQYVIRHQET